MAKDKWETSKSSNWGYFHPYKWSYFNWPLFPPLQVELFHPSEITVFFCAHLWSPLNLDLKDFFKSVLLAAQGWCRFGSWLKSAGANPLGVRCVLKASSWTSGMGWLLLGDGVPAKSRGHEKLTWPMADSGD